jgi:hypothetical protein
MFGLYVMNILRKLFPKGSIIDIKLFITSIAHVHKYRIDWKYISFAYKGIHKAVIMGGSTT